MLNEANPIKETPMPIASNDLVVWSEGQGRVLNLTGTKDVTKSAGAESPLARVRIYKDGQPTAEVVAVPIDQLQPAPPAPEGYAIDKAATAAELDAILSKHSDGERVQLASALFSSMLPQLPRVMVGGNDPTAFEGVGQATNGLPSRQ
jgi:hypothetical protein